MPTITGVNPQIDPFKPKGIVPQYDTNTAFNKANEVLVSNGFAPIQSQANAPDTSATPTIGSVYSNLMPNSTTQSVPDFYAGLSTSGNDTQSVRQKTLDQFQAEIDAVNRIYAEQLAQAKKIGEGQLGSSAAIQARRGLLGSDFGATQTNVVQEANRARENEVLARQQRELQGIYKEARGEAQTQEDVIATDIATTAIGAGIDLTKLSVEDLNSIAAQYGVSPLRVLSAYQTNLPEAATVKDQTYTIDGNLVRINQETGQADVLYSAPQKQEDGGFTLGEGQARYDARGNLIAGSAMGGTLSGAVSDYAGTGAVSDEARNWARLIESGQAKIDNVPSNMRSQVASALGQMPAKQTAAQQRASDQATVAITAIDDALRIIPEVFGGALGRVFGAVVPGTDARDLSGQITTVKALIGFDQLQKMREASPTGGALGQVSERELAYLQSVAGSLDVGQKREQLETTLTSVKNSFERLRAISNLTLTPEQYEKKFPDATVAEIAEYIKAKEESPNQSFNSVSGDTNVAAIANAIGQVESRGNYNALGKTVVSGQYSGERALGKYQIMPGNLSQWSKEAIGRVVTPDEFLASPELQDAIAQHRLSIIYSQYGNADDVASVWFSGRPLSGNTAQDVNKTSVPEYVKRVRQYLYA